MPIEFRCPSCSKLLRTPDESAGKKAKCPQCGTIVDVPTSAGAGFSPPLPSGEPSPFGGQGPADFSTDPFAGIPPSKSFPAGAAGPLNPYAAPSSSGMAYGTTAGVEEFPRTGLPWEIGPKSAKTYWATVKLILSSPSEAFSLVHRAGGVGTPLGFVVVGAVIGGVLTGIYNTLFQAGVASFLTAAGGQNQAAAGIQWIQVVLALPMAVIFGTIGAMIGSFIYAGIYHVFLMMLGGAKFEYETTYRAVAYVQGSVALLQIIPLFGALASAVIGLIYTIIAIYHMHRISGGKAAAAVLLPVLVCGGIVVAALVTAIVLGISFAAANG
jgi:hypothetical protein